MSGLGEQQSCIRYTTAMRAGVGRLGINSCGNNADETVEESLHFVNKAMISDGYGGLRSKRLCNMLISRAKSTVNTACGTFIQKLQNRYSITLVVVHRYGEKSPRPITGGLVDFTCASEIEAFRSVSVFNIDGTVV